MPLSWNRRGIVKLWGLSMALIGLLALPAGSRVGQADDVVTPNGTITYTATRTLSGNGLNIATPTFVPPASYTMGKVAGGNYAQLTTNPLDGVTPTFSPNGPEGVGAAIFFTTAQDNQNFLVDLNGILTTGGKGKGGQIKWNANEKEATVTAVTVVSGATQTNMKQNYPNHGDQDWGIVKKANTSVIVRVTTSPNTDAVWRQVQWQGGHRVPGHDNERSYSAAISKEDKIKPTINGVGTEPALTIWVIWATVTIDSSGKDPAKWLPFPSNFDYGGGQILGIQYRYAKSQVDFPNCQIAQMTPSGVHNVVSGGCVMKQKRKIHDFKNITHHGQFWDTGWVGDGPDAGNYTVEPDSADKVYAIDSPNQYLLAGETQDDIYGDYRDHLEWGGVKCSGYGYWYFEAGAKSTANPVIYFARGGTGQIKVPKTDPQAAENPN